MAVATLGLAQAGARPADCGALIGYAPDGKAVVSVPLKNTKVDAEVIGLASRVTVVQTFQNASRTPIEAVYTFPLPEDAAVDRMRIQVGERVIEGQIRKREEARAIYDAARQSGRIATLLDQERPNVFTQSISNIIPGAQVKVEISYVNTVKYEDGEAVFTFPMVVGPRNVSAAPDPDKIAPPTLPPSMRTGADVQLHLSIDAGAPIIGFRSVLHQVRANRRGQRLEIDLARKDEIPNRDFIIRYNIAGDAVKESFLTHAEADGGTFALVLTPPKPDATITPGKREIYFVIDQSGSQNGFPIEKSKELTLAMMDQLRPGDTFNVATFTTTNNVLFEQAVPADGDHIAMASNFVKGLQANGGTDILGVVKLINSLPTSPGRDRIVLLNTDGYVGDEFEILSEVQKGHGARWFTFGIGNSVNRFLIDNIAAEGRGSSEVVTLADTADRAVERLAKRLRTPVLTDIKLSVEGIDVSGVSPGWIPDVYSDQPVVIYGRYNRAGRGRAMLTGMSGGRPYERVLNLTFPQRGDTGSAIETLWARHRVDDLLRQNWAASRQGSQETEGLVTQVTNLALRYHIMSPFTSFVAVEPRVVNVGGRQRTVHVPVDMADGVDMVGHLKDKVFGAPQALFYSAPAGSAGLGGGGNSKGVARSTAQTANTVLRGRSDGSGVPPSSPEAKIAATLRNKKGVLEVQIRLKELTEEALAKLKKAGFKIDDRDKTLPVLFGTVDAKDLEKLSKLDEVLAIDPLL